MQKPRQQSNVERNCRDTQTVQQKHIVQQTTNDMSTQMTKVGMYVSNMEDKLVIPGKYTTADDFQSNVLNRVRSITNHIGHSFCQLLSTFINRALIERFFVKCLK